jgi:23S rRNA (uracil1939-C5)-methyltransferase
LIKLPVIDGTYLLCFDCNAHDYRPQPRQPHFDLFETWKDQRAMKQRREGYRAGECLEVTIERIVPGGEGLARGPNGVVLVEHAAPGDRLEIEIESQRGGAARGRIRTLLRAGAGRVEPACVWYGRCGGCDFQHLSYETQLDAKEAILRDALRRIGGIDWDGPLQRFAAPHAFGSRARVGLHVNQQTGAIGFFAKRSNDIVSIERCIVSRPEINAALTTIRTSGADLPAAVHLLAGNGTAHSAPAISPMNDGPVWLTVSGFDYLVDPAGFFQSSYDLLPALIGHVLDLAGAERGLAWDLFSGVGLFSLPLARQYRDVVGVEVDPAATANANRSAERNGIGNARFVRADVTQWVSARRQRSLYPDLVVVDPPRLGLGEVLSTTLAEKHLRSLIYISCDPTTLARDLKILIASTLRIRRIAIFDLFPQTHHIETVVQLVGESEL